MQQERRSGTAKLLFALCVFAVPVGGYRYYQSRNVDPAASMPLPNADTRKSSCDLWFVGSSSIARWTTLERDMAPWRAINRGISGATLAYVNQRLANESAGSRPAGIFIYGGDNDIAYGEKVSDVVADFNGFLYLKSKRVGQVPTFVLSLKPSPARAEQLDEQRLFNSSARRIAENRADTIYVDIAPKMLRGGKPGPFYADDGIHLNTDGYHIWAKAVRSALRRGLPRSVVRRCEQGRRHAEDRG